MVFMDVVATEEAFSTTANIYAHLDCSSKLISADAMLNGLGMDSK